MGIFTIKLSSFILVYYWNSCLSLDVQDGEVYVYGTVAIAFGILHTNIITECRHRF